MRKYTHSFRLLFLVSLLALGFQITSLKAQNDTMFVHSGGAISYQIMISAIDSITFSTSNVPTVIPLEFIKIDGGTFTMGVSIPTLIYLEKHKLSDPIFQMLGDCTTCMGM